MVFKSKRKGNRFENQILKTLRKLDPDSYKTVASGSADYDKGDLAYKDYLIECKHHKKITAAMINKWWKKIKEEAANKGKKPLLIYKQNQQPTMVMMTDKDYDRKIIFFDDFIAYENFLRIKKNVNKVVNKK